MYFVYSNVMYMYYEITFTVHFVDKVGFQIIQFCNHISI